MNSFIILNICIQLSNDRTSGELIMTPIIKIAAGQYFLLSIVLLFTSLTTSGQVLNGKIVDHQTEEPIPFANIYFNNSTRGTSSDQDGLFKLELNQFLGQEIVISCVGYKSEVIIEVDPGKFYVFYLKQQTTLLKDITIYAEPDDTPREKKIEMFLNDFLGQTKNSAKCTIDNLDDITLVYLKSSNTLMATSSVPLIIRNDALGYTIKYFLEEFKKTEDRMYYYGYAIFKEDTILSKKDLRKIQTNRKRAYLGSRTHFFRVLWSNQLKKSNFKIVDAELGTQPLLVCTLVDGDDSLKHFTYSNTLKVTYSRNWESYITFRDSGKIKFNRNGYFDPREHAWLGDMASQRIADLLPFDYWP